MFRSYSYRRERNRLKCPTEIIKNSPLEKKKPGIEYGLSYVNIITDPPTIENKQATPYIEYGLSYVNSIADPPTIENKQAPPYIISVHGPPKVGKTLLIKSLVKFYSKGKRIDDSHMGGGPIRIMAGSKRRIQFVECPNNVNGMIDASKYADAVIFLIDVGYEFEMETFEFLELLKVHGMPNVIGVLTYIDSFKQECTRKHTLQRLMDQFQTKICKGAPLFCLSGLDKLTNTYLDHEIEQLANKISTMEWSQRAAALGPFMLVDHFDMDTQGIIFKGYLRGCHIKEGTMVHIAGVGDFRLARVTTLADPFPVDSHLSESTSCMENRAGSYVSFEFHDVPLEMFKNHDPCQPPPPLLIGGITTETEGDVGYIQVKLERHNWHLKLLKSKDPIIVSVGWRRYETRPIYARKDFHGRYRFLKGTPQNEPCFATFWGPLPPPNTQLAVVQTLADDKAAFRFLAKGIVVDVNQAVQIVKKVKRIGTPCKISRKDALIKNMFKSDLEIANFKDAKIRTVSGIDGKIIEPAGEDLIDGPGEGIAKCIFTHTIRKCDTISMNVYEQVVVPRSFNPRMTCPNPPDLIWVDSVDTSKAIHLFVTADRVRERLILDKEECKVISHWLHMACSHWNETSKELEETSKEFDDAAAALDEWVRTVRKREVEEERKRNPPPRRGTLEQLRGVRFTRLTKPLIFY